MLKFRLSDAPFLVFSRTSALWRYPTVEMQQRRPTSSRRTAPASAESAQPAAVPDPAEAVTESPKQEEEAMAVAVGLGVETLSEEELPSPQGFVICVRKCCHVFGFANTYRWIYHHASEQHGNRAEAYKVFIYLGEEGGGLLLLKERSNSITHLSES